MNEQKPDNTLRYGFWLLCFLAVIAFFTYVFQKTGILDDLISKAFALFFTR
jgi:hypothetical protein